MANLHGQGPITGAGPTSVFYTAPFPHSPGDRARDNAGNEYLFVDFIGTVYYGCFVQIDSSRRASALLGTANRPYQVGVVMGGTASSVSDAHPTSDHGGWVQIYGVHPAVQTGVATDGGVSDTAGGEYYCIPQTSVGTPSGVLALQVPAVAVSVINTSTSANVIFGMWVVDFAEVTDLTTWPGVSGASGPSSIGGTNTSAYIGQTYAVFLNYPYVTGIQKPLVDDTSDS